MAVNKTIKIFPYLSTALGESTEASYTAHLLLFIHGVNSSQRITLHEGCEKQTNFRNL
jgi:hypothetical protein